MSNYENVLKVRYKDLEEISIRQEVIDFFTGFDYGEEKETIYMMKKLRRDANRNPKHCPMCWDNFRNQGKKECPNCLGLGYQYDEVIAYGYMSLMNSQRFRLFPVDIGTLGKTAENVFMFVTRYDEPIYSGDRIYGLKLTQEGFVENPFIYASEYVATINARYRLDQGRGEYNFAVCNKVQ